MGMASAGFSGGYVIQVVDPPDGKGYMPRTFDEGQIAANISDLGKLNEFYLISSFCKVDGGLFETRCPISQERHGASLALCGNMRMR